MGGAWREIFGFIWRGRVEWVAREDMYTGLAAGGRAVPCLPIKALCMFVAFQCKLAAGLFDHKARFLVRLWLGFPVRHLLPLSLSRPWTMEVPEHFRRVFCFIKENPWVLERLY